MPKTTTVGAVVRARREALGLTREQLAVAAGVSGSTLANLELKDRVPKHAIMQRIATRLDLPIGDIYAAAS